jgi:glucokinase
MKNRMVGLVADVGGTNARFALVDDAGRIRFPRSYLCREYGSLAAIIEEYLEHVAGKNRPPRAAIAVAGPVIDGEIEFTNLDWRVSEVELLAAFDLEAVSLLNDFAAQALAAPRLAPEDLRTIGPTSRGAEFDPIVVLGAGSGFGVAGLARTERGDVAISTEGGHAGFSPYDEVEAEIWKRLRAKYGRVSIERLLSGPGMYDIYLSLCEQAGRGPELADEKMVLEASSADDALAVAAVERFCAIFGSAAGDFALAYGARGGVYISGGIAPRMLDRLAGGPFRSRFEDKGRLCDFVRDIPTAVIIHPYPALVGAARRLAQLES